MDGYLTGKGYDQSQTTIDVNAPRSEKLVTPDNLKGQGLVFVFRGYQLANLLHSAAHGVLHALSVNFILQSSGNDIQIQRTVFLARVFNRDLV